MILPSKFQIKQHREGFNSSSDSLLVDSSAADESEGKIDRAMTLFGLQRQRSEEEPPQWANDVILILIIDGSIW
jgi:hypothetical protein